MISRYFVLLLLLTAIEAKAQLTFPNGKNLKIESKENHLYFETEVLFHTGKYLITDYNFVKTNSNSPKSWLLMACMNGDCKGNLSDSGNFIKDFGFNDTTGFIRVHVFTNDSLGTANYSYKIINRYDSLDFAEISVSITNNFNVSVKEPNKLIKKWTIQNNIIEFCPIELSSHQKFFIYDLNGKAVVSQMNLQNQMTRFDFNNYKSGNYIFMISSGNNKESIKFRKF